MVKTTLAVLMFAAILLLIPAPALADGDGNGNVVIANGYQIELLFKEPVKIGENEFHIQITDSMGMPVPNAEVEVSAMPVEGMEMETEAPSVGVMTSNNSMDGMGMATEVPSTGVMKPNNSPEDVHGENVITVMLEPAMETGEYAGEMHFDASGEWMMNVHFTINGQTTQVDFPVDIARDLGRNYAVLVGFFGINGTVIAIAASLKKRKSVVVHK
jgi:hypothetical protein